MHSLYTPLDCPSEEKDKPASREEYDASTSLPQCLFLWVNLPSQVGTTSMVLLYFRGLIIPLKINVVCSGEAEHTAVDSCLLGFFLSQATYVTVLKARHEEVHLKLVKYPRYHGRWSFFAHGLSGNSCSNSLKIPKQTKKKDCLCLNTWFMPPNLTEGRRPRAPSTDPLYEDSKFL